MRVFINTKLLDCGNKVLHYILLTKPAIVRSYENINALSRSHVVDVAYLFTLLSAISAMLLAQINKYSNSTNVSLRNAISKFLSTDNFES